MTKERSADWALLATAVVDLRRGLRNLLERLAEAERLAPPHQKPVFSGVRQAVGRLADAATQALKGRRERGGRAKGRPRVPQTLTS